jgi:hypothetical protein
LALSEDEIADQQLGGLKLRLLEIERERDDTSTLLPWTVIVVGVVATALGAGIGIARTVSCDGSCRGDFWPGWVVLGGATVGSLGVLWLLLTEEELSALRSRHYHLQTQIDAIELNRTLTGGTSASLRGPMLRWHARF